LEKEPAMRHFLNILIAITLWTALPANGWSGVDEEIPDPDVRTVAVWDFDNATIAGLADITQVDYLVRSLPETIVSKLVNVPGLKIVERVHLREVLEEINRGSLELTSEKSRLKLGRLSGAKYMVFGNFMAMGPTVQVSVRVVDVETSLMTFVDNKTGSLKKLSRMVDSLSTKVARSFAKGRLSVTGFGWKQNTKLWKKQDQGLRLLDRRKYAQAIKVFQGILDKHPDFYPAKRQIQMAELGDAYRQGTDFMKAKKYKEAVEAFKKVLKQNPSFKPARKNLKKALKLKRQAL